MLTSGADTIALIQRTGIAVAGASGSGRLHGIGRAVRAAAGAEVGYVTNIHRVAARVERPFEAIEGAVRADTATHFLVVADIGRGSAHRAGVAGRMLAEV